eukprot:5052291-Pleurochrysis_carterae.AAC.3
MTPSRIDSRCGVGARRTRRMAWAWWANGHARRRTGWESGSAKRSPERNKRKEGANLRLAEREGRGEEKTRKRKEWGIEG